MSYTLAKNVKINEKTGVISGEFAESNVTDYNGKRIYEYCEDIYNNKEGTRTPIEKFSRFIYDIQAGNIQGSLGKWGKPTFTNYFKDREYFAAKYPDKDSFVLTYEKYKPAIDKLLEEKEKYAIKLSSNTYLKKLNRKTFYHTYDINEAKLYSLNNLSNIKRVFPDSEVVNIETNAVYKIRDYEPSQNINPKQEIETAYNLIIPNNMSFKEISNKIELLALSIKNFSNKDLDETTIKEFYQNQIKEILQDNPLFELVENKKDFNIITSVYPELVKSSYKNDDKKNPSFFIGYSYKCLNLETGEEKNYPPNSMMISYILSDLNDTKMNLLWKEQDFIEDKNNEVKNQTQSVDMEDEEL